MTRAFLSIMASLLLAAGCLASRAAATTLARMSLEDLARAAGAVVRVQCLSAASRWDGGMIWTFTELEVVESFKGAAPSRITVRLPGGRVGHLVAAIEGVPKFRTGEESFLFLEKTAAGDYTVTAWAEGTFRISSNPRTGTQAVTQESSSLPVFDSATKRFHAEGIRNLSMPEFRRRLAAALAHSAFGESR